MNARELDGCSRSELIARAVSIGVDNAKVLTRAELTDEILRRTVSDPLERRVARGLLGVARDLVARVVERGLHLPDAAAVIRGSRPKWGAFADEKPPIATVTLAEIYANQGHRGRALAVLDEVLRNEPEHAAARALRDEVAANAVDEPVADRVAEPAPERPHDVLDGAAPAPAPARSASFPRRSRRWLPPCKRGGQRRPSQSSHPRRRRRRPRRASSSQRRWRPRRANRWGCSTTLRSRPTTTSTKSC